MGYQRKYLSSEGLHRTVRACFSAETTYPRCQRSDISWQDCLMSGLAVFGLKFPSLLQFENKKNTETVVRQNLKTLYGVENAPSDTCLRERLDTLSPDHIRKAFKKIFAHLQRGKVLESYRYIDGYHILSIDGTGQYSSNKVHCENCCVKRHRTGKVSYYHQMLGAVIVHPEKRIVIPLAPEPIVKGDGYTKNDCERNASKRLLSHFRREHPHFKTLIVEDGLASNYPHLSLIDSFKMKYVIGVKPGDHVYLFDWIKDLKANVYRECDADGTEHLFHYYHDVPLNAAHYDYRVNVIDYVETKKNGKQQHFSWVTNFDVSEANVYALMRAGRARWRIENETFNTLKNQGYHFEHNYGHGKKNLCSVLTMLMLLAFLIDQTRELCDNRYQAARKRQGPLYSLFEQVRVLVQHVYWNSWASLYDRLAGIIEDPPPTWH